MTVLFADVVHSMDIAAAVGPERLREIMADLADRCAAVVRRCGGTVDKFTGDGIMAVFGAPLALEDHAVRACLAALGVQEGAKQLAVDVQDRDGISLQVRVGLNSGQVIAGEVGSAALGYTAIGEQVGMAQRMESVAPPGGVMISASTARLVDRSAALGAAELVQIKGADEPVRAHRLLGVGGPRRVVGPAESNLIGRRWEMSAVEGLLDRAVDGHGAVVGVVGPPGIGKSRLVREVVAIAGRRGVEVFTGFCESHASQVPFHAVARLLRATTGAQDLDRQVARDRVRAQVTDVDPEDLALLEDLLAIADPDTALPKIDPDARWRRLTALIKAASLARQTPAVYVVEDAQWIDEASESMVADFLTVIPQTPSLVLLTYRPEYEGGLTRVHGAQTIALAPLSDSETDALITELLGSDLSVGALGQTIVERSAGNPFFAEEIVRELAERGVLKGELGAYISTVEGAEVAVPATLQATIAARIDRLDPEAKLKLGAAAVIGSQFGLDLLEALGVEPTVADLVAAHLIDQVGFTPQPEFVFHHPLIRAVAYEAQLKSDRAELHRRVADALQTGDPATAEEKAALIAHHLDAAGDSHGAYAWHMRAATWATNRDIAAARVNWDRARQIADALPADAHRTAMQIAPRTLLCGTAWRAHLDKLDRFDELRDLCTLACDKASLAIGMAGLTMERVFNGRAREGSRLASEHMEVIESIGDPTLTVGLSFAAILAKHNTGEMADVLRWSQAVIDLAEGDAFKGNFIIGSPLAWALATRGVARWVLGHAGWHDDFDNALAMARNTDPMSHAYVVHATYGLAIPFGVLLADDAALRIIDEAHQSAERCADDSALLNTQMALGLALVHRDSALDRERGLQVLAQCRELSRPRRLLWEAHDIYAAREKGRVGDHNAAVPPLRAAVDDSLNSGQLGPFAVATQFLVETLLDRGSEGDLAEAETAIDRVVAVMVENGGSTMTDFLLLPLKALRALALGDEVAYRDYRDTYRATAESLGFEGHMKWAETMP